MVRRPSQAGVRMRHLREQQGWSQGQLARIANVTRAWVQAFETGTIQEPGAADLLAVADALGVPPAYLLYGRGAPPEAATFSGPPEKVGWFRQWLALTADQLAQVNELIGVLYYRGVSQPAEGAPHDGDMVQGDATEEQQRDAREGDEPEAL